MRRIAKFSKVSDFQFIDDFYKLYEKIPITPETGETITDIYENINLPKRADKGSAGYDFYAPFDFTIMPGETFTIPTGIRCKMRKDYVLFIVPRSSLGFKYQMALVNTVGVIDSSYFEADNQGHIMAKLKNNGEKELNIKAGERFAQGIFIPYGITIDDNPKGKRTGGIGSSGK